MSLITRCPACGTMFKVVPDQLRISEGWVRCGHCTEIFDAPQHLQPQQAVAAVVLPPPSEPVQVASEIPPPVAAPMVPAAPAPPPVADVPPEPQAIEEAPVPPEAPEPPPVVVLVPDEEQVRVSQPAELAPTSAPGDEENLGYSLDEAIASARSEAAASLPEERPHEEAEEDEDAREADAGAALNEVSFVREARRKALWRRPAVRALLGLVLLALLVLLGLQMAVQERDRLAAFEPRTRPWLERLCEPLQCQVGPLRQIESVVIDGTSFNKQRGDAYRLSLTLRNTAALPVALPAIELVLTDTQDQPVLRRVLQPAEYGAAQQQVLGAHAEWAGGFTASVAGVGARIAGYRVLAFYP